ncbi:MAG: hypothetical protein ABF449_10380 [Ethanoligenens sp.]|uniref:hypothetical protein n=1 Tax=Ethanoligenens sp. TaxID=2099655 RepID=UPI0039EA87DF
MATKKSEPGETFLEYKGKPLVRSGDTLYYGNIYDKYVIMMQIKNRTKIKDVDAAGTIQVQLLSTDNDVRVRDRVIKKTEKEGLYNALDIGSIWLERALNEM